MIVKFSRTDKAFLARGACMKFTIILTSLLFSLSLSAKVLTYDQVESIAKDVLKEDNSTLVDMPINDIKLFCPKYATLSADEKEDFFANLVASISKFESNYDTNQTFLENNGNVSTGLLQISYKSISPKYRKYGCKNINSTDDLKNARNNLRCGFGIIKALVKDSGYLAKSPGIGASAYWSTLRPPYKIFIKAINKTAVVGKRNDVIAQIKKKDVRCFN